MKKKKTLYCFAIFAIVIVSRRTLKPVEKIQQNKNYILKRKMRVVGSWQLAVGSW